jgi:stage V sporulation protein R
MAGRLESDARLLYTGADWDYRLVRKAFDAIEHIAVEEMGLNPYPSQIEVISSEQMLDAYSSMGMPLFYRHWSFGKHFARDEMYYRKGVTGLAYEIVINSNPCLCYIMEENTMTMQTLVMAHAAFGHSHFFRNNQLFRTWTDADSILDYLDFAKRYVSECEERYGARAVERVLDAAHALMSHGVHRYPRRQPLNLKQEMERERQRQRFEEQSFSDLWRTLPRREAEDGGSDPDLDARRASLRLPEENLLYFLEKRAPRLAHWQREILRIVRIVAQYFYPQRQTKVMNEGCATTVHYAIMTPTPRDRADHRWRLHGIPARAHQRGLPAGLRRPPLLGHQPLRARLRHPAGSQARLRGPHGRRPALVPRHRRQCGYAWHLEDRVGRIP